jgi:hypothetical protein
LLAFATSAMELPGHADYSCLQYYGAHVSSYVNVSDAAITNTVLLHTHCKYRQLRVIILQSCPQTHVTFHVFRLLIVTIFREEYTKNTMKITEDMRTNRILKQESYKYDGN